MRTVRFRHGDASGGADAPTLRRLSGCARGAGPAEWLAASFLRLALALVFALTAGGHSAMSAAPAGSGAAGLLALCGAVSPSADTEGEDRATNAGLSCAHCVICAANTAGSPAAVDPRLIEEPLFRTVADEFAASPRRSGQGWARAPPA